MWYNILRLDSVLDFGLNIFTLLDPRPHIEMICCRTFKVLGPIMRTASDFKLEGNY